MVEVEEEQNGGVREVVGGGGGGAWLGQGKGNFQILAHSEVARREVEVGSNLVLTSSASRRSSSWSRGWKQVGRKERKKERKSLFL